MFLWTKRDGDKSFAGNNRSSKSLFWRTSTGCSRPARYHTLDDDDDDDDDNEDDDDNDDDDGDDDDGDDDKHEDHQLEDEGEGDDDAEKKMIMMTQHSRRAANLLLSNRTHS